MADNVAAEDGGYHSTHSNASVPGGADGNGNNEEEEEKECRVCRGPAEEGHPLYKPCKCSGSIGLVHQDCLQSWLRVQHGHGAVGGGGGGGADGGNGNGGGGSTTRYGTKCELCKTPFRFRPVYADGAPDRLSPAQVAAGVLHCAASRWVPLFVRVAFCLCLWLLVAPLITCWLYQAWVHRPHAVLGRLRTDLIKGDFVAGAVIVAVVIVSFLSLMSFADFLRVEVARPAGGFLNPEDNPNGENNNNERQRQQRRRGGGRFGGGGLRPGIPEEPRPDPAESDIDNELWTQSQRHILQNLNQQQGEGGPDPVAAAGRERQPIRRLDHPSLERRVDALHREIERERDERLRELGERQRRLEEMVRMRQDRRRRDNERLQLRHNREDEEDSDDDEASNSDSDVHTSDEEEEDEEEDEALDEDDEEEASDEEEDVDGDDDSDDDSWDDIGTEEEEEEDDDEVEEEEDDEDEDVVVADAVDDRLQAAGVGPLQPHERLLERQFLDQDRPNNNNNNGDGNNDRRLRNNNNRHRHLPPPADRRARPQPNLQPNDPRLDRAARNVDEDDDDDDLGMPPIPADLLGPGNDEPIGEVDINIALDELLGVRGPIANVFRNLMWLLAFNTLYLGFFAFTPRLVGMSVTTLLFNSTNPLSGDVVESDADDLSRIARHLYVPGPSQFYLFPSLVRSPSPAADNPTCDAAAANAMAAIQNVTDAGAAVCNAAVESATVMVAENATSSFLGILRAVEAESARQKTTFRLSVLISIGVGYLSCAGVVMLLRGIWVLSKKVHLFRARRRGGTGNRRANRRRPHANNRNPEDADEVREAIDEIQDLIMFGADNNAGGNVNGPVGEEQGVAVGFMLGVVLDIMAAIVKVGLLLLLKMFLLPIVLGLCLDASTLSLFGSTLEDRILYAGGDLFSFTLLHWVAGITFMLLVTVSVLQLREVAHPQLLAQVIRPQEPQPDLLGNLLNDSVPTHGKRMALSLVIYAALLTMHVYLPIRFLVATGIASWLPFLQVKISHIIMPQLQVPLELLFFHLCMLGILEKNKNSIGEMQHYWLKFMCRQLGFVDCVLPRTVQEFRLIGIRQVYLGTTMEVDPFWYDLAKAEKNPREELIWKNLDTFEDVPFDHDPFSPGETKRNGERVLRFGSDYIRLPVRLPGRALRSRSLLLPTKMGRYRIKRDLLNDENPIFQLWEEVAGDAIPRPPEGWDDLGAGGADVQGRWAWGRERKSTLERGVAARNVFYHEEASPFKKAAVAIKLMILMVMSWATTTFCLFSLVLGPLAIGRFVYYVLRFQDSWIHDPFAFAIGCIFFFPPVRSFLSFCTRQSVSEVVGLWLARFHPPPMSKLGTLLVTAFLTFGISPFLLGWILDICLIKSPSWFAPEEQEHHQWIDTKSCVLNWVLGFVLIDMWLDFCVVGVLTKRFWEGAAAEPAARGDNNARGVRGGNNNNDGAAAARDGGGAGADAEQARWGPRREAPAKPWQGPRGRAAAFVDVWGASLLRFEWDRVDYEILMTDVAIPVAIELSITLLLTVAAMALSYWRLPMLSGYWRGRFVQGLMSVVVSLQVARAWQEQVFSWFEAAHRAARDDRYLIGEVLMNYNDQ